MGVERTGVSHDPPQQRERRGADSANSGTEARGLRPERHRCAARVFLLDEDGRVLLLRFEMGDPDLPPDFWATPGGGVEAGETELAAAQWIEGGIAVHSEDAFFLGRCGRTTPVLSGVTDAERRVLKEMRWWTLAELTATEEQVFPPGLAGLLSGFV